jgi:hypothetical protein
LSDSSADISGAPLSSGTTAGGQAAVESPHAAAETDRDGADDDDGHAASSPWTVA